MSGRFKGTLPKSLKVHGILADMTTFIIDVKVHKADDIPLDKVMLELLMILGQNMSQFFLTVSFEKKGS